MSEAFLKIVNMSISASYLVLAVLVLRLILKKAPKWVSVLLWGMVAVRLILPISIESTLSLIPTADPIPDKVIAELHADVQTDAPVPVRPHSPADNTADMPVSEGTGGQDLVGVAVEEEPDIQTVTVLTALWLAGVAGMLVYTAVSYLLLRHRVATAVRLRNNIYRSENVDSPFVLGFLGPKIYLPFRMDSGDLPLVIAHEEAHIRRKDHWWKPIGFVLLSIHWFNPLMWIGYILLCRDIELACDEKVIREMDNETKADYTQALVSCSVNRRRIAACPLAFGEVGVKERVKTVMNYKKPAFWIVIAAVALCAVVAVSFLTNPKDYGPEVGNPKMLELPGVEWFVTPEEFKEALNITKKQIISEDINSLPGDTDGSDDTYELSVTDLTLFGKEVHYALFSFDRAPDGEFEFVQAVVMFDEDTDMEQLKDNLVEIYGTGSSEPYSYYLYEGNVKRNYPLKLRMEQRLEYLSKTGGQEGNPFKDALEDPEYMIHHWVTENGCSFLPEEVVEWFKYAMDRPANADEVALQDDEVLMEMLDQLPWVAMTLSNRNAATIQQDAQGTDNESAAYYTNNYMEFNAGWLAQYRHEVRKTQMSDPGLLEYPGLKWGMTAEEVKTALNLSDDQVSMGQEIGSPCLTAKDLTLFGYSLKGAKFYFSMDEAAPYANGLCSITAYFTEDTDMTQVRDAMIGIYGDGDNWSGVDYHIGINGELYSSTAVLKNPNRLQHYWRINGKVGDLVEDMEDVITFFENAYPKATRQTVEEYLELHDIAGIGLVDTAETEGPLVDSSVATKNVVQFNGIGVMWYMQNFGEGAAKPKGPAASTDSTEAEETTMPYDPPYLWYPDITWGMQPHQIKKILGVTEEQIILEWPMIDQYMLHIKDFTFLGNEVLSGQFNFIVSDSGQYHFSDVALYFPEETDMAEVRDDLVAYYGPPKDGVGFTRYKVSDAATVYDYTDYGRKTLFFPEDTPVNAWWESEVTLADSLPESKVDMLAYRAVLLNDHDEAFDKAFREYLEKEPAHFIFCTNGYDLAGNNDPYYTKNVVVLSAVKYVEFTTD